MHKITYKLPEELKREFNQSINQKNKSFIRIALFGGLFLYSVFALLDQALVPELVDVFWFIRFGIILPVTIITILLTYSETAYRFIQPILSVVVVISGLGIIAMILLAPSPVNYNYYAGLILVIIFSYTFLRVRFIWATIAGWCIVAGYEIGAVYIIHTPTEVLINNNFFFISANLLGMVSNLSYETNLKKEFHTAYRLMLSNNQIAENNIELEKSVKERTKELNELNRKLVDEIREKEEAKRASENSNQITSKFLAKMSHELRNPIQKIINITSRIKGEIESNHNEELKTSFAEINSVSGKVAHTVDHILKVSELNLGTYQLNIRSIDIINLLQNLYLEYYKTAASKQLGLFFFFDKDTSIIENDYYAVNQIFVRLIESCIELSSKGKIEITLEHKEDSKITVRIENSAKGISEDYLDFWFDRYSKEEKEYSKKYEGGLSLAIAKKYCDLTNIGMSSSSDKERGTIFQLVITGNHSS